MRLVALGLLQRVAGRRARRLTLLHILHNSARSLRLVILNAIYTRLHMTATMTAKSNLERRLVVWPASTVASTVLAGAPQVMSEL